MAGGSSRFPADGYSQGVPPIFPLSMNQGTFRSKLPPLIWALLILAVVGVFASGAGNRPALAATEAGYTRAGYVLPPDIVKSGVTFAGIKIRLDRKGVAVRVVDQINYLLMDRRAVMIKWFDRMSQRGPLIRKILAAEKVPADLRFLPVLLSGMLPNFRTRSGGVGLWALGSKRENHRRRLPAQWISTNDWDDRRDPAVSTRIACTMLQSLCRKKYAGDWLIAVCAFVDGAEPIDRAVKKAKGFSYWELVLPHYSEVIIPRLIALKIIDSHREYYGMDFARPGPLKYDFLGRLKLRKDLPLHMVAKWCGASPRHMWELNPGIDPSTGLLPKPEKRNPSGFPLRVPKGMGRKVKKLLVQHGYLSN